MNEQPQQPPYPSRDAWPEFTKPPAEPWYARPSAPLRRDEVDEFDKRVPGRVKQRGSIFGNIGG